MKLVDILALSIVAILFFAAVLYIRKQKKTGTVCVGCPNSGACSGKCSGCQSRCSTK